MSDRCPTCGRAYLKTPAPKYATAEQRKAGVRAVHAANTRRRHEQDRRVLALLPTDKPFTGNDVGLACRRVGRFYSDHQGIIGRALRFGAIMSTTRLTPTGKTRRLYHLVDPASPSASPNGC